MQQGINLILLFSGSSIFTLFAVGQAAIFPQRKTEGGVPVSRGSDKGDRSPWRCRPRCPSERGGAAATMWAIRSWGDWNRCDKEGAQWLRSGAVWTGRNSQRVGSGKAIEGDGGGRGGGHQGAAKSSELRHRLDG